GKSVATLASDASHQHDSELRGHAQRSGLDGEGLFGAGEACEIEEDRHLSLPRLVRLIDGELHRQANEGRLVAVETLQPAERLMLAEGFELHRCPTQPAARRGGSRPGCCSARSFTSHYESDRAVRSRRRCRAAEL